MITLSFYWFKISHYSYKYLYYILRYHLTGKNIGMYIWLCVILDIFLKGTLDWWYINQKNNFKVVVGIKCHTICFSTTLIWYKLDTLLLKQKNLSILDLTNFFLRPSVFTWVIEVEMKPVISNTDRFCCFNYTVSFTYMYSQPVK